MAGPKNGKGNKKSSRTKEENVDNVENNDAIVIDDDQDQDMDVEDNNNNNNNENNDGNDTDNNDENNNDDAADGADNDDDNDNEEEAGNNENEDDGDNDDDDEEDDDDKGDDNDNNNNKETRKRGRRKGSSNSRARLKRKGDRGYRIYLFKILQQVHPNVGITKTAMDIVNCFIQDMFDRICQEAMKLTQYHKTNTITAREISTAVKLILPGELQKHAVEEGQKALTIYDKASKRLKQGRAEQRKKNGPGVFPGKKKDNN